MIDIQASHLVTDIEGTTTDLAFVHRVLFPYALRHMAEFVVQHADEPEVRAQLDTVAARTQSNPAALSKLVDHLEQWIDEDRKDPALKALQGMIWRRGYEDGDFTGHVYADAHTGLQRWRDAGVQLNVYSSGSVQAQQLLYGHSDFGDLTPLFSGWFDTRVGAKQDSASYARIIKELDVPAGRCVFLSDVVEELDAAAQAGLQTVQIDRAEVLKDGPHPVAYTFDEIEIKP